MVETDLGINVVNALIGNGPVGIALLSLAWVGKGYLAALRDERANLLGIIQNNTESTAKNTMAIMHLSTLVQTVLSGRFPGHIDRQE
jgi:hypothetical protein